MAATLEQQKERIETFNQLLLQAKNKGIDLSQIAAGLDDIGPIDLGDGREASLGALILDFVNEVGRAAALLQKILDEADVVGPDAALTDVDGVQTTVAHPMRLQASLRRLMSKGKIA